MLVETMKRLVAEWLISQAGNTSHMRRAAYMAVETLTLTELEEACKRIGEIGVKK